jgi:hypothetical protein
MRKEIPGMCVMNRVVLATLMLGAMWSAHAELPERDGYVHMGVATCATSQCHGSAVPQTGSAIMQNEYVTWTQDDPHSRAYEVLSNDLSKAIAARLGIDNAYTAKICLDCHADNVASARRGDKFQLSDGVGCESCHGGAKNWLSTHYNTPTVQHSDNLAAGMYATENVTAKAELCLSCHLGTSDKFATHRLMAAGHPRLAFELDTFTELWRTAGRQPHYRVDGDYVERKGAVNHVVTWANGVIVESRQRLALISGESFAGSSLFPELGLYDCHACHRSMKTVQWRQLPRHGHAGPGAPFLNDGTLVMSLALARAVNANDATALEIAITAMHVAGTGNGAGLREATAEVDAILATLQSRITPAVLANRESQILRELLATGAEGNYLDYVSAEQAFMAVQMLVFELHDKSLDDELNALGNALEDDERYRPAQFARLLAALGGAQ